jgi:phospholipase C
MTIPDPDPGELFTDMTYQLYERYFVDVGLLAPPTPTMGGFVRNYVNQTVGNTLPYDPRAIMHCFHPDQVPVTSLLAKTFGVADRWFSSAPCQTWPNRFFVHSATADGWVNNTPVPDAWKVVERLPYDMPTIFNQIKQHFLAFDKGWRIYFHDMPQSIVLSQLWDHLDHFHSIERFKDDVAGGDLQPYSFIEPRYGVIVEKNALPNDQHPPHDVTLGEQLIADVYNTLRASSAWTKTLLIVLWDEPGGCYDSVPPGSAQPPDDGRSPKPGQDGFIFNRYGARVPALLISPYIPPGIVQPPAEVPFDHTSVIKTVRERFAPGAAPLTKRDAVAPSVAGALTLGPDNLNLGPTQLAMPLYVPPPALVAAAAAAPMTNFQRSLLYAAAALPPHELALPHRALMRTGVKPSVAPLPITTPGEARPYIKAKVNAFLGRLEAE